MDSFTPTFHTKDLGLCEYTEIFKAMKAFTHNRKAHTIDEIWLLEHLPVYTLGTKTTLNNLPQNRIPIIQSDRGGQMTYHGPGQLIIYPLLNLMRLKCSIRTLVTALENTIIQVLKDYHIKAHAQRKAPGVYIGSDKIASIGLRIHHGACYHGIALNINMDLTPFHAIDPCGFVNLGITQLAYWTNLPEIAQVKTQFLHYWHQQKFYANVASQ